MITPLLAESIDGALALLFGIPILVIGIALLSFWPAFRGHWSAPILAAPAILFGISQCHSLTTAQDKEHLMSGLWGWALAPLFVGFASIVLWVYRIPPPKERS